MVIHAPNCAIGHKAGLMPDSSRWYWCGSMEVRARATMRTCVHTGLIDTRRCTGESDSHVP